jgi:hypothetical protein
MAARVGKSLADRLFFLRKNKTAPTTSAADDLWLSATMSAFSEVESAECSQDDEPEEDVDPLVEAEIYVIFGRANDAEKVLKSALQAGRIDADEVVRFWGRMDTEGKSTSVR